jgi:hypothetical protein
MTKEKAELAIKNGVVIAGISGMISLFHLALTLTKVNGDFGLLSANELALFINLIVCAFGAYGLSKKRSSAGVVLTLGSTLLLIAHVFVFGMNTSVLVFVLFRLFFIYTFSQATKGCIALRHLSAEKTEY